MTKICLVIYSTIMQLDIFYARVVRVVRSGSVEHVLSLHNPGFIYIFTCNKNI